MVAGPEIARLVSGYKVVSKKKDKRPNTKHHNEATTSQKAFLENVRKLCSTLAEMGNPFEEESSDLLSLDTKDIADPGKAQLVPMHYAQGKEQFTSFMKCLENEDRSSFYDPIKKNKLLFFSHKQEPAKSKEKIIKEDCGLFSRLFLMSEQRVRPSGIFRIREPVFSCITERQWKTPFLLEIAVGRHPEK